MSKLLYGLERNYRGLCEERYLYTLDQLAENDPSFPGGDPENYEGAFFANDTYYVFRLDTYKDVLAFIKGDNNHDCGILDPEMIELAEWYSDFKSSCLFTNKENPTAVKHLKENGLADADLSVWDDRYDELIKKGFSRDFFYEDGNREKSYLEVMEEEDK